MKIELKEDPVWLYNTNTEWCQYCFEIVLDNQKITFCPEIIEPCSFTDLLEISFSSLDELIQFVKEQLEKRSISPERDFRDFIDLLKEFNLVK